MTDPQAEQIARENELTRNSILHYAGRLREIQDKGLETVTQPVIHAIRHYLEPMKQGIVAAMGEAKNRPGRHSAAYQLLYNADGWVLSLLTLRTVLDSVSKPRRVQTIAVRVGREVELEYRIGMMERAEPKLATTIAKHIEKSPHAYRRDYREKVWVHASNKYRTPWEPWTEEQRYGVGMFLIDAMIRYTGLVRFNTYREGRGTRIDLAATETFLQWLDKQHEVCSAMRPRRLPMVCPPLPWTNRRDGGYLTPAMRRRPLTKVAVKSYEDEYTAEKMPVVFHAVNYLQAVPWQVNRRVLDVAGRLWDRGQVLPKTCLRHELDLPPKPPQDAPKDDKRVYKSRAREIHVTNQRNRGRRIAAATTLDIARRDADRTLWFPHDLDFRGRTYPSAQYLSPQGADLAKGLLTFANREPLGERGAWWLAVHVANTFGQDKLTLEDRVAWTYANSEWIAQVAADPFEYTQWHQADSPFCFLAAAFEWLGFLEEGPAYPSSLPITVDGSCNGIQHLAALSQDAEAGALVNLVPMGKPSDIYARVAQELTKLVEADRSDEEVGRWAELWLHYGITRSLCKRPTMIMPYNGTRTAVRSYIDDHISDTVETTGSHPFAENRGKALSYLTGRMWEAMNRVVTGPRETMTWAGKVAAKANANSMPVVWRSPSGFLVIQAYRETTSRRVRTKIGDVAYRHTLRTVLEELNKARQVRAVAPNWVHSLDAAALHYTIWAMTALGIRSMMAVHDSYGTHACHMDTLANTLREQFVHMYLSCDQRVQFATQVAEHAGVLPTELPEYPALGTLDLNLVLSSPYFFS